MSRRFLQSIRHGIHAIEKHSQTPDKFKHTDCVAFIGDESVSVVVSAREGGLTDADVAKITEIVTDETGMEASQVKIIEAEG